jgi:hypothetical protein
MSTFLAHSRPDFGFSHRDLRIMDPLAHSESTASFSGKDLAIKEGGKTACFCSKCIRGYFHDYRNAVNT